MDLILILCAGKHERWTGDVPKQCVEVDGMPLIKRTGKLIDQLWTTPVMKGVVTHDMHIFEDIWGAATRTVLIEPPYNKYICGTLLSTMGYWMSFSRFIVLLGDVVYSPELLTCIRSDPLPNGVRFYGSKAERWAMAWAVDLNETIADVCIKAINAVWNYNALDKLATMYRLLAGHPLRKPHTQCDELYTMWDHDYVDDFDTVEEYEKWIQRNQ